MRQGNRRQARSVAGDREVLVELFEPADKVHEAAAVLVEEARLRDRPRSERELPQPVAKSRELLVVRVQPAVERRHLLPRIPHDREPEIAVEFPRIEGPDLRGRGMNAVSAAIPFSPRAAPMQLVVPDVCPAEPAVEEHDAPQRRLDGVAPRAPQVHEYESPSMTDHAPSLRYPKGSSAPRVRNLDEKAGRAAVKRSRIGRSAKLPPRKSKGESSTAPLTSGRVDAPLSA